MPKKRITGIRVEVSQMENKSRKILIADDEIEILSLLKVMCESRGYHPIEASNGLEAYEKALEYLPDLMLMDAVMPSMNGFEVTEKLKKDKRTEHIPIIMLTGLKSREDRLKGISVGANDFLTKPIDVDELLLRVQNNLKIKEYHDFLGHHNAILEQQVAERTKELQDALEKVTRANRDTIFKLAVTSEYKDENTGAHVRRISFYSKELSFQLGMDEKFNETIFYASAMHDIGKVHTPDEILLKPGKLTPEEWEVMKSHTITGAEILRGSESPYLKMAEQIALTHHERWDGSGYPYGLSGEDIAHVGRIVNIVDQYDALRTERPYKHAINHEEAVKIITEGDGRTMPQHFDPRVIDTFRSCAQKLAEIHREYSDDKPVLDWQSK